MVSGTLTVNSAAVMPALSLAPVSAGGGRLANLIVNASAVRTQVNRDGSVQTAQLSLCALGVQGSDQYVYQGQPWTDWNGFCLQVVTATDLPAGQPGWLVYPNGFPSKQVEVYYNLPSQNYPNIYHADNPFNPQLSISSQPLSCTAPSTMPQVARATAAYQFCYQAYSVAGSPSGAWQSSVGGMLTTLATPGLTALSSVGLTGPTYGQYVLAVSGTRLAQNGSGSSTNPIVGVSWINPGGLDGNDGNPDPFILPTTPHLSGVCALSAVAFGNKSDACLGGLILYAANPFYFANGYEQIDSPYALVNAVDLRLVNGSVFEASGPVPTFSQLSVAPLAAGSSPAACPLITSAAAASTIDASPLFSAAAVAASPTVNVSFAYYIGSNGFAGTTPLSANGYWSVAVSGILTLQPIAASLASFSGAANSTRYPTTYIVVGATGERIYTDATGNTTVSAITGVAPVAFGYSAGSALVSALGNTNVLYTAPTTVNGMGYGGWTVDAGGLVFTVQAPTSAPLGNPGLPGFPTTARFNSIIYLQLISTATTGLFREKGWGPISIDVNSAAPSSFTSEYGAQLAAYTTSLGVQLFPATNPLPVTLQQFNTSVAYATVGLCCIVYPDETAQNGMWSIATSALLYVSPQVFQYPFGFTNGTGSVVRPTQLIYALSQLTRVYIDQFGVQHVSTGAVLQGQGGDGGSDNLLYGNIVAGDREGLYVDGDGFTYTLLGAGAVTPGDPTLAPGINFYSEFNYREAAEPWHQDGEYGGTGTSFTITPGATSAPSCVAQPFSAVPQTAQANIHFAFCYAITGSAGWSVVTTGVFTAAPNAFTSFNSANALFYFVGVGISGTRTYLASATATPQISSITGLPGPGGDGQYDGKLYQASYLLDSGGWGFYVSPPAQVFGLNDTSSIVRVYNFNTSSGGSLAGLTAGTVGGTAYGPWLEVGLPQLTGFSASAVTSSGFFLQPYVGNTYSTCTATQAVLPATASASLCVMFYSLPGNIDHTFSIAISMTFVYNSTTVTTPYGTAVPVLSGSGTRVYTNRFGVVQLTTAFTIAPPVNASNLLYLGNALPVDPTGLTLNLASAIPLPGHGPTVTYTTLRLYNASGIVLESGSSRIDSLGSAFLSSVAGFNNVTIGASNINSLAPNYGACQAPITFTNRVRPTFVANGSNGAMRVSYSYFISDGATYSVQGNLTLTMSSASGSNFDALGNPYQIVSNVSGTRLYTYLPNGGTVLSTVFGLTTGAYAYADQRFYPYALLSSAPGVYSTNTAPLWDYDGLEFGISPAAPEAGMPPGVGTQYNATSVYFETPESTAVLTDGYFVNLPLAQYQQQYYTLLQ